MAQQAILSIELSIPDPTQNLQTCERYEISSCFVKVLSIHFERGDPGSLNLGASGISYAGPVVIRAGLGAH